MAPHCTAVIALIAIVAAACSPRPAQPVAYKSPEELVATLKGESLARRSPLFDSLQLSRCQGNPCEKIRHCPEFTVFHPRLDAVAETAVVQVICWHQSVDLVVLRKEGPNTWRWVDTVALTNRYGDLQLGFESVVKPPVQEIVVRNDEGYAGTGAFGGVFMLLKLVDGRRSHSFVPRPSP